MLNALGYAVTISGQETRLFSPRTLAAVRAFQRANNLSPVGNVGPATRALLNSIIATQ